MSYKAEATNKLLASGLLVPPSFIINREDYPHLEKLLAKYSDVEFWYLRSTRTEERALSRRVVPASELSGVLNESLTRNPSAQIIVQGRVDVRYSGVLSKTNEAIFIEYVKGGLQSLLRDGVNPSRMVFNSSGKILAHEENEQEFWYRWEGDKLVTESATKAGRLPDHINNALLRTANLSEEPVIYEWLEDQKGKVFFIDIKTIPAAFLVDKNYLLSGFERRTFVTLDLPIQGQIVRNIHDAEKGVFLLSQPLYIYIDDILQRATAVVIKKGGVLSHLSLYATKNNIPCVISDFYYHKFFTVNEVNISSAELLNNHS